MGHVGLVNLGMKIGSGGPKVLACKSTYVRCMRPDVTASQRVLVGIGEDDARLTSDG